MDLSFLANFVSAVRRESDSGTAVTTQEQKCPLVSHEIKQMVIIIMIVTLISY